MTSNTWVLSYAGVWVVYFLLFGMQRATLLISRNAGFEWRGGGELLLPTWYPVTWLAIIAHWGLLGAMVFFWDWRYALGVGFAGYVLSVVLPIPYSMYMPIFRNRANQISEVDRDIGGALKAMLDDAPF